MANDQFFLTEQVIAAEKYFNVSRYDIEMHLMDEGQVCELEEEQIITDSEGVEHCVNIRINIYCKGENVLAWSIAMKLHCVRIDGIDWHAKYDDPAGNVQRGWHRHRYNSKQGNADKDRYPVTGFDDIDTISEFLIRSFKEMNISLSKVDNGTANLFPN